MTGLGKGAVLQLWNTFEEMTGHQHVLKINVLFNAN